MLKEHILNHYQKEEHPFVEKVIDWAEKVINTHQPVLTDFVDPRQLQIILNIVNSYMDLTMFFDGGFDQAERVRVLIAPDYYVYQPKEMGLVFFRVTGETKFESLSHRDYMGALLHLGLKREKFGDILLSETENQLVVAEEAADYVSMQLTKIAHTPIRLERIDRHMLLPPEQQYQIIHLTVSSLRLDTIVAQIYHQSRSNVTEWIMKGHVKVNWQVIERSDYNLQINDLVSVKGFGRFKFLVKEGNTKKGRIRLKIGKLI